MASPGARRVEVPEAMQRRHDAPQPDYASAFALSIGARRFLTPQQWARATFEGAPAFVKVFLTVSWRYALGLRLGAPSSPDHVLGWSISSSGSESITLEAQSPRMVAQSIVTVREATVDLVTLVRFTGRSGRILWAMATPLHNRLIPYLLGRAGR